MTTPTKSLIHERLIALLKEIGAVGKDGHNDAQRYKFRALDDVCNAMHPLLAKHGIVTVPSVQNVHTDQYTSKSGGNMIHAVVTMQYRFVAEDGSFEAATTVGEGADSSDKACNKAMSAAYKYALCQTFNIPTEDGDADSPAVGAAAADTQDAPTHDYRSQWATEAQDKRAMQAQVHEMRAKENSSMSDPAFITAVARKEIPGGHIDTPAKLTAVWEAIQGGHYTLADATLIPAPATA